MPIKSPPTTSHYFPLTNSIHLPPFCQNLSIKFRPPSWTFGSNAGVRSKILPVENVDTAFPFDFYVYSVRTTGQSYLAPFSNIILTDTNAKGTYDDNGTGCAKKVNVIKIIVMPDAAMNEIFFLKS